MKRLLVCVCTLAMILSLTACGSDKKVFEISKEAFREIECAYSIVDEFGADIYKAWHLAVSEPARIQNEGVAFLAADLSLTEDDVRGGLGYGIAVGEGREWSDLSDEEKEQYKQQSDQFLKDTPNESVLQYTIYAIPFSYIANGKTAEAQTALDSAKSRMREISEKHADYDHYPNLKGYYTTVSSYFEFCQKPTGTFEMMETTVNEYRNDIRDYRYDLEFVFGE